FPEKSSIAKLWHEMQPGFIRSDGLVNPIDVEILSSSGTRDNDCFRQIIISPLAVDHGVILTDVEIQHGGIVGGAVVAVNIAHAFANNRDPGLDECGHGYGSSEIATVFVRLTNSLVELAGVSATLVFHTIRNRRLSPSNSGRNDAL